MNAYLKLDASFWCKDFEYPLYPLSIEESDDSVEIISQVRDSEVHRGCIGNLILTGVDGIDVDSFEKTSSSLRHCYCNVLLGKIQILSASPDNAPTWKYIFLKE